MMEKVEKWTEEDIRKITKIKNITDILFFPMMIAAFFLVTLYIKPQEILLGIWIISITPIVGTSLIWKILLGKEFKRFGWWRTFRKHLLLDLESDNRMIDFYDSYIQNCRETWKYDTLSYNDFSKKTNKAVHNAIAGRLENIPRDRWVFYIITLVILITILVLTMTDNINREYIENILYIIFSFIQRVMILLLEH